MRVVLQRVSRASVSVEGSLVSEIGKGFLILLGIEEADGLEDIRWLVGKISKMRVFDDDEGKMNLSLADCQGDALVVSQFTLHARTKKGTRPSFDQAAAPEEAEARYEKFVDALSTALGKPVACGRFGAMMQVALVNDGPVTLLLDSLRRE